MKKKIEHQNSLTNNINLFFETKFEKVVYILSKLKEKAQKTGDVETSEDLNYCLKTLSDNDLHSPISENVKIQDGIKMDLLNVYSNLFKSLKLKNDATIVSKIIDEKNRRNSTKNLELKEPELSSSIKNNITEEHKFSLNNIKNSDVSQITSILETVVTENFNIFSLQKLAGNATIFFVLSQGFKVFNLLEIINEQKFLNFCRELMNGYNPNDSDVKYHSSIHGADVCQTTIVILKNGQLLEKLGLGNIDMIASITAAAAHDFKHNGFNNMFHVNKGSELALTYNDNTVLENWHVSQMFKMLVKDENNFLENFTPSEYRHMRRRMIDGILSTDMARHSEKRTQTLTMIKQYNIKNGENFKKIIEGDALVKFNNQQLVISQIIHTADLSNPAKKGEVYNAWTSLLYQEFFLQGDTERSMHMQVSPLCDRNSVNIPDAQVGFIKFVVLPQFEMMFELIPEMKVYKKNIESNLKDEKNKANKKG